MLNESDQKIVQYRITRKYEEMVNSHVIMDNTTNKNSWEKINKAQLFCDFLEQKNIFYEYCFKHPEVLGCDESKSYYQRFCSYVENYTICKNLAVHERKGKHRKFLIITDQSKQVDLKKLKEVLVSSKLEFISEEELATLLNTYPGNVSIFNLLYDKDQQVELIIDEELLTSELLVFHPLYNGMSMFIKPKEIIKFLNMLKRNRTMTELPKKEPLCLKK